MTKEKFLQIRIDEAEKQEMKIEAKSEGFDNVTDYVLACHRERKMKSRKICPTCGQEIKKP
jgi:rRNA maturation endonuclease Nob1